MPVLGHLQKRLLSSIEAFARTLSVHRKNAAKTIAAAIPKGSDAPVSLKLFQEDDDGEDIAEDEVAEVADLEIARATRAGASAEDDARARKLLDEMTTLAEASRDRPDAKIEHLLGWIRENQCPDLPKHGQSTKGVAKWLPRRVLIFTEYTDTKNYLLHQLEAAFAGTDQHEDRILALHGGMDEDTREEIKQAFNNPHHAVRILIGTDAAREDVNLQAQCSDLFHFDLPWNPGRMEQRNGRIDRMLQPDTQVRCQYFVYAQRPEDAVLEALVRKSVRIHEELGSIADVIEQRLSLTLRNGISRKGARELSRVIEAPDAQASVDQSEAVREELEVARDNELTAQLEELGRLSQKARDHLDIAPERLRDVVNLGLLQAGVPPLTPLKAPADSYSVAAMDKLSADPTWREVVDTLRPPRPRKMPIWEWRSNAPARPVSFEPSTTLASETVQLHLQHRLTQKALAQFRAQAFAEDRLSRVAVVFDPTHARKRVLALGRLSLYGTSASRLHEEILATAAFWVESEDRDRLEPFTTTEAEERALASLGAVLSRDDQPAVPQHIVSMLMKTAKQDEDVLWEKVESRARARTALAEERLNRRAQVESEEMGRILQAQKVAIDKELGKRKKDARAAADGVQVTMPWLPQEQDQKAQYDLDTKYIEKRLGELEMELTSEPERMLRLMNLAVYPARVLKASPFPPKGWLPKANRVKERTYLFPHEEAAVLACTDVPLVWRLFFGFCAREGLRRENAVTLEWSNLTLDLPGGGGDIVLDKTKNGRGGNWHLDAGTAEALRRWRPLCPSERLVFPTEALPRHRRRRAGLPLSADHAGLKLREALALAGQVRPKLFQRDANRIPIRAHDLRATFVTLALALGKTEDWVTRRTGHCSSVMLARYRRDAETLREHDLGWLVDLHEHLPELKISNAEPMSSEPITSG